MVFRKIVGKTNKTLARQFQWLRFFFDAGSWFDIVSSNYQTFRIDVTYRLSCQHHEGRPKMNETKIILRFRLPTYQYTLEANNPTVRSLGYPATRFEDRLMLDRLNFFTTRANMGSIRISS
jgi:hypothetical protein